MGSMDRGTLAQAVDRLLAGAECLAVAHRLEVAAVAARQHYATIREAA